MAVVEPVVTQEKLRQLLDEQHESAQLDFKEQLDLSLQRDKVELAKDIGAMLVDGAYIVVGATDSGVPSKAMTAERARRFDEASVRDIVKKWIPEPFDIRVGRHVIDDCHLVLLYVGASPDGMCVFRADGQYSDGGKSTTIFRAGDVFARHGSKSERMAQQDIGRIVARLVDEQKESWRAEILATLVPSLRQGDMAQQIARGPVAGYSLTLPIDTFSATTVEVMRAGDDTGLRSVLNAATAGTGRLLRAGAGADSLAEVEAVVDRVAAVAAVAVTYNRRAEFDLALATLERIYEQGFDRSGHRNGTLSVRPEQLWLAVMERVHAVGALAVRQQQWWAVPLLALQRPEMEDVGYYGSWVRHTLTEASRAGLFHQVDGGRQVEVSMLYLAKRVAEAVPALHPDVDPDDEALLDSLCQFDLLAAVAAIGAADSTDMRFFYPSFARFDSDRVRPVLRKLINEGPVRSAVFAGDNAQLAAALRELLRLASSVAANYSLFFVQYDHAVEQFIADNTPAT